MLFNALFAGLWFVPGRVPAQPDIRIWANNGEDKVTREELRLSQPNGRKVLNRLWDGTTITLFGARNEVVNFNLVLESPAGTATGVSIGFNSLLPVRAARLSGRPRLPATRCSIGSTGP